MLVPSSMFFLLLTIDRVDCNLIKCGEKRGGRALIYGQG